MALEIPEVPEALFKPVRALTRAALLFRQLLAEAARRDAAVLGLLAQEQESALVADRVLDRWLEHFGLPDGPDLPPAEAKGPPRTPPPPPRRWGAGGGRGR